MCSIRIPDFSQKDIRTIRKAISSFEYGKYDLIKSPNDFRVVRTKDKIILENYRHALTSNNGNCEELTLKATQRLKKIFKNKYIFVPAETILSEFSMNHFFLLVLKNNTENISIIEKLKADKEKALNKLYNPLCALLYSAKSIDQKIEKLALIPNMFKKSFIIDPSFKKVEHFSYENNEAKNYIGSLIVKTIDIFKEPPTTKISPNQKELISLPLGYLKKLAPEITTPENRNNLVFLEILSKPERYHFGLSHKSPHSKEDIFINVHKELKPNTPLMNFLQHVVKNSKIE